MEVRVAELSIDRLRTQVGAWLSNAKQPNHQVHLGRLSATLKSYVDMQRNNRSCLYKLKFLGRIPWLKDKFKAQQIKENAEQVLSEDIQTLLLRMEDDGQNDDVYMGQIRRSLTKYRATVDPFLNKKRGNTELFCDTLSAEFDIATPHQLTVLMRESITDWVSCETDAVKSSYHQNKEDTIKAIREFGDYLMAHINPTTGMLEPKPKSGTLRLPVPLIGHYSSLPANLVIDGHAEVFRGRDVGDFSLNGLHVKGDLTYGSAKKREGYAYFSLNGFKVDGVLKLFTNAHSVALPENIGGIDLSESPNFRRFIRSDTGYQQIGLEVIPALPKSGVKGHPVQINLAGCKDLSLIARAKLENLYGTRVRLPPIHPKVQEMRDNIDKWIELETSRDDCSGDQQDEIVRLGAMLKNNIDPETAMITPENGKLQFETSAKSLPKGLVIAADNVEVTAHQVDSLPIRWEATGDVTFRMNSVQGDSQWSYEDNSIRTSGNFTMHSTGLIRGPRLMQVGGHIDYNGCPNLRNFGVLGGETDLCDWGGVTSLEQCLNGETRRFDVSRCYHLDLGIVERQAIGGATGMQILLPPQAQEFQSLSQHFDLWKSLAGDTETECPDFDDLDEMESDEIKQFLSRLMQTPDFRDEEVRKKLASVVLELLTNLDEDTLRDIHDGLTGCNDRIMNTFDIIALRIAVQAAEESVVCGHDPEGVELKALAKGLMRLEKVDKKIAEHLQTLTEEQAKEAVEIDRLVKTTLAKRLGFNFRCSSHMQFSNFAAISQEQVDQIGDSVLEEEQEGDLERFLDQWDPWQAYNRRQQVTSYEELVATDVPISDSAKSIITKETLEDIKQSTDPQPVVVLGLGDPRLYEYHALRQWFVLHGTDPATQQPINWQENVCKLLT